MDIISNNLEFQQDFKCNIFWKYKKTIQRADLVFNSDRASLLFIRSNDGSGE
jgi:hypothetical protein